MTISTIVISDSKNISQSDLFLEFVLIINNFNRAFIEKLILKKKTAKEKTKHSISSNII